MYSIYADGVCIYDDVSPSASLRLISPKLTMSDSAAGSLTMTMPVTNAGYDSIVPLVTNITVYKHGEEIWSGRVLTEDFTFDRSRVLHCEGELAFLNDTIQPQAEWHDVTVSGFLGRLLANHNSQVAADKQFTLGDVTVTDPNNSLYRYTNYESTLACITDKLLDRLGGHLRIRKVNGVRYLDYLADYPRQSEQSIIFGRNLMDFTRQWDLSDFATVILPLGSQQEESDIEALPNYLTVESVNNDSPYVVSEEAVSAYGWIVKVVHWDDVTTPSRLLKKARKYLQDIQFEEMTLALSALDLHYLHVDEEPIGLLDKVRVVSRIHGLDRYFPVTKLEIPLDDPSDTLFTLGGVVRSTLTGDYQSLHTTVSTVNTKVDTVSTKLDTAQGVLRQEFKAANGVLESSISQTYATKSELSGTETTLSTSLSQTAESIRTEVSKKVGTSEFGTYMQQNYDSFLLGFNGNSRVIQLSTAGIGIYGGAVDDTNKLIALNQSGMEIFRDGVLVGRIGTNNIVGYPNYRGLVFDLDSGGSYMTWASMNEETGNYTTMLTYARTAGASFGTHGFYIGDSIFMSGHTLNKANLTEVRANGHTTFSGERTFVTAVRSTADGSIEYDTVTCTIDNGMFIN